MKKIDSFIHKYPVSKTLRFELIPVDKTLKNMNTDMVIDSDVERSEKYKEVKKLIDNYHKNFIEKCLSSIYLNINSYAELFFNTNKDDKYKDKIDVIEKDLRNSVADSFRNYPVESNNKIFDKLFKKEMITDILPNYLMQESDKQLVKDFEKFTTYFTGFNENRKNIYSKEPISTSIAYRIVHDNLPFYLENIKSFEKIKAKLSITDLSELNNHYENLEKYFEIDGFNKVLTQSGIDAYNLCLGGYSKENNEKIKGINEYVNLFNQTHGERLPKLKPLYKQILSDRSSFSYIPEMFKNDSEIIEALDVYLNDSCDNSLVEVINRFNGLIENIINFDSELVYIKSDYITTISKDILGSWNTFQDVWNRLYDANNTSKKNEKYFEKRDKAYKSIKYFSVNYIDSIINMEEIAKVSIYKYLNDKTNELTSDTLESSKELQKLIDSLNTQDSYALKQESKLKIIKKCLDNIKALERYVSYFDCNDNELEKDSIFYGELNQIIKKIRGVDVLYSKVRNYLTKKPYSTDKIKINFNRSDFLSGWAQTHKWDAKEAHLFEKDSHYYLYITNRSMNNEIYSILNDGENYEGAYHLEYYFQKPDMKNAPRMFIRSARDKYSPAISQYNLPIKDVVEIYDNGYFKTEFKKINPELFRDSLTKMIDYYKKGFSRHESYSDFSFNWKESCEYQNISDFFKDTCDSCYKICKNEINFNALKALVNKGEGYLFEIYSKDFSTYSKGKNNLNTLYFKMLFDDNNLKDICYKLSGGAELFWRKKSIAEDNKIVHVANSSIANKNELNEKKESIFSYDITKDYRYTVDKFFLHLPIVANFKANERGGNDINSNVRKLLRDSDSNYIIGIDRGERNLLYVVVIDNKGNIVEQLSLNEIINNVGDNSVVTDYHNLLDKKEKERQLSRQNWTAIENIKEIKEGYISQVVHKLCLLIEKYDAIVILEDLNSGFKNSRVKVEKQVYQKFEKALIDKLNFYVNKDTDISCPGGLLNAYQMTNKFESFSKMGKQNGILFYVPAYLTSKIDPTTGFASLIKPKYSSIKDSKSFVESLEAIRYNEIEDIFEFDINYDRYPGGSTSYIKKWTICSNDNRIRNYRNSSGKWDYKYVHLTTEFKQLFSDHSIKYHENLKEQILLQEDKQFFVRFMNILSLVLQMRNSIPGRTDVDYLISPVKNKDNAFFDSRKLVSSKSILPYDADANGAYNIALKGLMLINSFKNVDPDKIDKVSMGIKNSEWLKFAQTK